MLSVGRFAFSEPQSVDDNGKICTAVKVMSDEYQCLTIKLDNTLVKEVCLLQLNSFHMFQLFGFDNVRVNKMNLRLLSSGL